MLETVESPDKETNHNGRAFRPPLPSPLFQAFIKALLPFVFKGLLRHLTVQVDDASLQRLKSLKGERRLLLSNHPTQWDPWVPLEVSRLVDENFYYVVARELFNKEFGLRGFLFQRMGCYSVVRGASDKESFRTTKDILAENKGPLMVFVEGEISNQNDSLLPLEPGVAQLAFLALNDLYKKHNRNLSQLPSLYICPMAIRYVFVAKGLNETIELSLQKLEKATGLMANGKSHYERVRDLGVTVFKESARQFGYNIPEHQSLEYQLKGLENFILNKMEQVVNLEYNPHLSYLDRVRRIRNTVDRILKEIPEDATHYQTVLHTHQKALLKNFYWDLDRIVNFIAIYDGYIYPEMGPERYVEVIRRLEREVFGTFHLVYPRTAIVQVMEPLDLKDYFAVFLQDKKYAAEYITRQIEISLYEGITSARLLQAATV